MLHAVAVAYHADPWAVLEWSPLRLGLAMACLDAAQALTDRRIAQVTGGGGMVFPTFQVGSLL